MYYDFDKIYNRKNTASKKWDTMKSHFDTEEDTIPLWVADMDFQAPTPVVESLKERASQGIYGYTVQTESHLKSVENWFKHRHNWNIDKSWISHSPGILPALSLIIHTFTQLNDKIVVQSPVHHAFYRVIHQQGRQVVENKLNVKDGYYTMDLEDLENKFKEGAKMIILCSPHNPVGRVWNKEELINLGALCLKYNALVVSDEVWCDIVYNKNKFIPYASLSNEFANHSITCVSPSKTFNLMSLKTSSIITPNDSLRQQFDNALDAFSLAAPNHFSLIAGESAYNFGGEWLDQLLSYLKGNIKFINEFLANSMPKIHFTEPEGTYLVWLDFREIGLSEKELKRIIVEEANVCLDEGSIFGTGGEGFMRVNIACPRSIIKKGLENIYDALKSNPTIASI